MPRTDAHTYLPLLDRALETEIGIGFTISGMPREQFRTMLYDARRASGDPRYDALILFAPAAPHDTEIWICNKAVDLEAP